MTEVTTVEVGGFKLRTLKLNGALHYVLSDITRAIGYRLQPKEAQAIRLSDMTGRETRLVAVSENELIARLLGTRRTEGGWLLDQLMLPPDWLSPMKAEYSILWTDKHGVVRLGHMPDTDCGCPECMRRLTH